MFSMVTLLSKVSETLFLFDRRPLPSCLEENIKENRPGIKDSPRRIGTVIFRAGTPWKELEFSIKRVMIVSERTRGGNDS